MIEFEKVQEAIRKANPEVRRMMFSAKLGEELSSIAEANKLDEEKTFKVVDEVGYVVLGLKQKISFLDSLVQIGIDKNTAEVIKKEVEGKVFSELDKIKNNSQQQRPNTPSQPPTKAPLNQTVPIAANKPIAPITPPKPEIKNNIGDSFEQAILTQARAMQVAQSKPITPITSNPPANLPGAEVVKEVPMVPKTPESSKPNIAVPNYTGGQDPYREPAV